ncbi:MAG: type II/IV secretion system protein [Candidatus Latescibacteria bacterium]|nr:type II/IV secretion system protein [Candidatus Latescibacterota bacterium]
MKIDRHNDDGVEISYEKRYGVPFIDLSQFKLDPEILSNFTEQFLREARVCPLFRSGNTLAVAMVDPHDIVTIDEVRRQTALEIETMVCREVDLLQAIAQFYSDRVAAPEEDILAEEIDITTLEPDANIEEKTESDIDMAPHTLEEVASEAPVVRWVNQMLTKAVRERASDIHVEPGRDGMRIRFRIDGILRPIASPKKNLQLGIISRLKIMSRMNIAEKRVPQDGRYGAIIDGREIDFRVSTFPTTYGETVVMRILDRIRLLSLTELGFSKHDLDIAQAMIAKPHGVIIVSGPTGCGKTTTLYAILNEIRGGEECIITIEDPVEYDMDSISQSAVNLRAGYTYLVGLRHILRQDPDVIMIGEVRDGETAGVAIRAALTGQLVFTSIHSNDAPGTITRLIDMDIEPFLVASAVEGAIAQRLVRKICPKCKEPYVPPAKLITDLELPGDAKFFRGKGCGHCRNTGYTGRIGLFEVLRTNDEIRDLVITRPTTTALRNLARKQDMQTLWEDGVQKVLAGITTLDEIMRETEKH